MRSLGYACMVLLGWSASARADADPFVGTWLMDARNSHFASGRSPKRMIIVMTPATGGIHYRSETQYADGQSSVSEYTASYQGALSMVTAHRRPHRRSLVHQGLESGGHQPARRQRRRPNDDRYDDFERRGRPELYEHCRVQAR
jgi:hypothetical protein